MVLCYDSFLHTWIARNPVLSLSRREKRLHSRFTSHVLKGVVLTKRRISSFGRLRALNMSQSRSIV